MKKDVSGRRQLIAGIGTTAAAVALSSAGAAAQGPATTFQPARHQQDDWMDTLPGKHRVILDITSPEGVPDGLRFVGNLFTGSKTGYGLEDRDLALIVVLRHSATATATARPSGRNTAGSWTRRRPSRRRRIRTTRHRAAS